MKKLLLSFIVLFGLLAASSMHAATPEKPANTFEIELTAAGTLQERALQIDADIIEGLVLTGPFNGADLSYICQGTGRMSRLRYLDFSGITIVSDNTPYTVRSITPVGMGTSYTYTYFLSETNYDELTEQRPTYFKWNCYRNDLSAAFNENKVIETVILPSGMTSIGEYAFAYCTNLTYVGAPSGISRVGTEAFYYSKVNLEEAYWISNLTEVGNSAFDNCQLPETLTFHRKNISFGTYAFARSTVKEVNMPYPPEILPAGLFFDSKLEKITIGDGLRVLERQSLCTSTLAEATFPETIEEIYADVLNYNFAIDRYCPYLLNLTPEDNIRYVGKVAYRIANQTTSYTIKEGTISLADGLFYGEPVQQVTLPTSLENIGNYCFCGSSLSSIELPENLRKIGYGVFERSQLSRITIPENVTYIGGSICQDCTSLWSVTYNAIHAEGNDVLLYTKSGLIANNIEQIVIGDKVKRLPSGIFTNNQHVNNPQLPESLETVGEKAFAYCKRLTDIRLPDGVTEIGSYAFGYCNQLRNFHWSLSLQSIGTRAFRECALHTISLPEGLTTLGSNPFLQVNHAERLYIPSTIQEIGDSAFPGVTYITCTATTPPAYSWTYSPVINKIAVVKVPKQSVEAYKSDGNWRNLASKIIPIETITSTEGTSSTSFGKEITDDTDLQDAVVGNVYVTVGEEDSYDANEGCLVLHSTMSDGEAEAIGGMAPGETDIANRFDGLIAKVNAGKGTVAIDCRTMGENLLNVKIGTAEPATYLHSERGEVLVTYDVSEPTYLYMYGSASANTPARTRQTRDAASATDNCVYIYAVSINHTGTGIMDTLNNGNEAPITDYYTIDGCKTETPTSSGVYIIRRSDGSVSKMLLR